MKYYRRLKAEARRRQRAEYWANLRSTRRLWERPLVYLPMGALCLLLWWMIICAGFKLWPR